MIERIKDWSIWIDWFGHGLPTAVAEHLAYEAAFPFAELGGRPARFGFVVFDNNYVGRKSAPYWLEFSPGIAGGMDASKLKLIQYR